MSRTFDVASSTFATLARMGAGWYATHKAKKKPEKLLELYEFEACPFCRKVREALTSFDLDAKVFPCPRGGRFRAKVKELGGKEQFPFLVDPNTGRSLYESSDIIRYLAETYETGGAPLGVSLGPVTLVASSIASAARSGYGRRSRGRETPPQLLELWSFEASPYSRLAREALCELELPYVLHNVGKQSDARPAFVARSGKMQVPYLVDPNVLTDDGKPTAMFESADIVRYLNATYA